MKLETIQLIILQLMNFAGNAGYSIGLPLYPPKAYDRGLDEAMIGYIMCLYPIGGLIVSLILGTNMSPSNMKKVVQLINIHQIMFIGLIITSFSLVGFGTLEHIYDKMTFTILSFVYRLMSGIGATFCFTPCYAMAAYLFPDKITQVFSKLEIVTGIAQFCAPLLGGLLFTVGEKTPFGGYAIPWYIMGFLTFMICPFLLKYFNVDNENNEKISFIADFNHEKPERKSQDRYKYSGMGQVITDGNQQNEKSLVLSVVEKLNYMKVFKIRGVSINCFIFTILFIAALAVRTYFAIYLKESYGLSDSQATLIFLIKSSTYGLTAILLGYLPKLNRRFAIISGLILFGSAFLMYGIQKKTIEGPDTRYTGLPHELWIVCIADGLYGIGGACLFVVFLPELVESMKEIYPNNQTDANDIASALYVSTWYIGEFAGPMIGGYTVDKYGYVNTCSFAGFIIFSLLLLYIVDSLLYYRKKTKTGDIGESLIV